MMKRYISNRPAAMLALVLTMAFWGSSFVVSKVAMQEVWRLPGQPNASFDGNPTTTRPNVRL